MAKTITGSSIRRYNPCGMRVLLAVFSLLLAGSAFAGADTEAPAAAAVSAQAEPMPEFPPDPAFETSYRIESVEVRGNQKTKTALILREVGLRAGDVVLANDARVGLARLKLLALGYFLDVHLSLVKPGKAETQEVPDPKTEVDIATSLIDFPLVEIGKLDASVVYHVSLRADLNPISEALVTNVRRWLSRPGSRAGSGESFFGSFVSVFVNPRVEDSERMLGVVSQPFQIPRGWLP
jgi:hypothetical protein